MLVEEWIMNELKSLGKEVYANSNPRSDNYPVIIYTNDSEEPLQVMDAASDFFTERISVDVYSYSKAESINLAKTVRELLDNRSDKEHGISKVIYSGSEDFYGINITGQSQYDEEKRVYGRSMNFEIWYSTV